MKGQIPYSAIVSMPLAFFFEKRRLSDEKLPRLERRLVVASAKPLNDDGARGGTSVATKDRDIWLGAGDMAPSRPDIEPFGVLRFLLGNNPNWALGEDMTDTERDDAPVGDMADAPDTDE